MNAPLPGKRSLTCPACAVTTRMPARDSGGRPALMRVLAGPRAPPGRGRHAAPGLPTGGRAAAARHALGGGPLMPGGPSGRAVDAIICPPHPASRPGCGWRCPGTAGLTGSAAAELTRDRRSAP